MTTKAFLCAAATAGACALSFPAFAHHPGGIGNSGSSGPINTISATTLPQGISVATFVYDHIGLDPLSDAALANVVEQAAANGDPHAHAHSLETISSPSLNFAYGLRDDLMLAVRLPYVHRSGIREAHYHEADGEAELHSRGSASGIGDLSLLAQWRFLDDRTSGTELALLLGGKAPTGATHETDRDGERFDAEFQPGSGSWDALAGLAMTQRSGPWSFDASVLYTATSTGALDTDLGDRLHYGASVAYRISGFMTAALPAPMFHGAKPHEPGDDGHKHQHRHVEASAPALDLILELNGEWHQRQDIAGEIDANSGGHTLYLAPGLRLSMDKWSAFASLGIPVVDNLNGVQAEPDWRLVAGVSIGF